MPLTAQRVRRLRINEVDPTVLIGVELEFDYDWSGGHTNFTTLSEIIARETGLSVLVEARQSRTSRHWCLKYEGSVSDGVEITSRAGTPNRILREIGKVLEVIKDHASLTRRCGMHVHISTSCHSDYELDVRAFSDKVIAEYMDHPWSERREYCEPEVCLHNTYGGRYYMVVPRHGRNHVEVRVFNGTKNLRRIRNRLQKILNMYHSCLSPRNQIVAPETEVTVRDQPIHSTLHYVA